MSLWVCLSVACRTHFEYWEVGVVLVHLSVCLSINDLQNSPWELRSWGCTGTPIGLSICLSVYQLTLELTLSTEKLGLYWYTCLSICPSMTYRTHLENWEVGVVLVHLSVCLYVHQLPTELTLRTEKLGLYWYTCMSVRLSVCLSVACRTHLENWEVGLVLVHLSVCMSVCLLPTELTLRTEKLGLYWYTCRSVCPSVCMSVTYRTHLENWEVGVVLVHLSVCLSINDL